MKVKTLEYVLNADHLDLIMTILIFSPLIGGTIAACIGGGWTAFGTGLLLTAFLAVVFYQPITFFYK